MAKILECVLIYQPNREDVLALKIGDRIEVTADINTDWVQGRLLDTEQYGLVPKAALAEVTEQASSQNEPTASDVQPTSTINEPVPAAVLQQTAQNEPTPTEVTDSASTHGNLETTEQSASQVSVASYGSASELAGAGSSVELHEEKKETPTDNTAFVKPLDTRPLDRPRHMSNEKRMQQWEQGKIELKRVFNELMSFEVPENWTPPETEASQAWPETMKQWTVEHVFAWTTSTVTSDVASILQAKQIHGARLMEQTHESLREMGLVSVGKRIKLLKAIKQQLGSEQPTGTQASSHSRVSSAGSRTSGMFKLEKRGSAIGMIVQKNLEPRGSITESPRGSISSQGTDSKRSSQKNLGANSTLSGTLHKLSGSGVTSSWKKRWCTLENGRLSIHKNNKELIAKHVVMLSANVAVAPVFDAGRKYAFKVVNGSQGVSVVLCADSQQEMAKWMQALSLTALSLGPDSATQPAAGGEFKAEAESEDSDSEPKDGKPAPPPPKPRGPLPARP
eukprot:Colp12_sorted_trinity150504_noHs@570